MGTRRFQPNERPPVRFVQTEELAYVATRAREVHDLWHVLFDCPTTVQGELALKALEFAQTGNPDASRSAGLRPCEITAGTAKATQTDALPVGLSRGREGRGPHVSRLRARVRDGARRTQAQVAHHAGAEGVSARGTTTYARDSFLFTRSPRASARLDPTESDRPHPRPARRASTLARPFPVDRLVLVRDSSRSTLGRASDAIIIARRSSRVALFRFALRHPPRKRLDFPLERRDRRDQRLAFRSQSRRLLLTRR